MHLIKWVIFALLATRSAWGFETLGQIGVSDFLLQPSFSYLEGGQGRFSFDSSYLGILWERDSIFSARLAVGTLDLLGVPARYGVAPAATGQVAVNAGLVEGYAQATGYLGRVRFGLVPIPFGLEGGDAELHLFLPRSYFWLNRMLPLRDGGFTYSVESDGFSSEWAIHNGEGGSDLDNQIWFTGRWGWRANPRFRTAVSASTGRTSPKSTNYLSTQSNAIAGIDITKPSRTRIGNALIDWKENAWHISGEATLGETQQDDGNLEFNYEHLDISYKLTGEVSLLSRYDQFYQRSDILGSSYGEKATLGAFYSWPDALSVIYVYVSKTIQNGLDPSQHSILAVWRLCPSVGEL